MLCGLLCSTVLDWTNKHKKEVCIITAEFNRPCANRQFNRLAYRLLCSKAPCNAWPDTTRGSAGEETGTKIGDKCRYGVPASGPEVRTNMTWGMGWMNYHYLLSMEVAASDLGPVRSPLLPCICMK